LYNFDTNSSIPANTSSGCVFNNKPNINRLWESSLKMEVFCIVNAWFKSGRFKHSWLCLAMNHTNLSHYKTYAVIGMKPRSRRFM